MNRLSVHSNEVELVKRLGLAAKDIRQEVDTSGDYYLVARITIKDLEITLFSESYQEPIVIEGD